MAKVSFFQIITKAGQIAGDTTTVITSFENLAKQFQGKPITLADFQTTILPVFANDVALIEKYIKDQDTIIFLNKLIEFINSQKR